MTGWNEATRETNHAELMRYVRSLPNAEYAAADARAAIVANPTGHKAGYYADLIAYCGMRRKGNL